MCETCHFDFCPDDCPEYHGNALDGGEIRESCEKCEGDLYNGDTYYLIDGNPYCVACVEDMSLGELAELCCELGVEEILERIGVEKRVA